VKYAPSEEQTTLRLSPRFLPYITHEVFAAMVWLIELELCSRFAEEKNSTLGSFYCDFRNRSTSRAVGIEGCAPTRVTEIAATAEA
jgi:hypothetical protein